MDFSALNQFFGIRQETLKKKIIARNQFGAKLRLEPLEDRLLLSFGNLLHTLDNPSTNPQESGYFGKAVAMDGELTVVGAFSATVQGCTDVGRVYIYNTTTGALLKTLENPTPANGDGFGASVAISGNIVVVGAPNDDAGASDAGAAYIYNATTGNLLFTLAKSTPKINDLFGYSVAVSGNTVVVGAYWDSASAYHCGAAYIFNATTGKLVSTLTKPLPAANDLFGCSVSVSSDIVVVGARADDTGATNAGAVYIFNASTGGFLRTLANPTPAANDAFGISVAVSGNNVVVGASGDASTGTAYLFNASTGGLLRTLANPTPTANDYFGNAVAVSDNNVVVAAYMDDIDANDVGTAYIFSASTGGLLHTLANPAPAAGDNFGNFVAVSGSTVAVGAAFDTAGANGSGSAYLFGATSGDILHTLNNPTPSINDLFGYATAISGNIVVVGASNEDKGANDAGAAYIFDANTGNLLFTLANPTPAAGDFFGNSVAISGRFAVVGAPCDDTDATDAGAVYIFDATTGGLLLTLNNPTPAVNDVFGYSVAICDNIVVVGAVQDDLGATNAGGAYLFNATTGVLLQTLANPTPDAADVFGFSVAISGNKVVVGAHQDDTGATDSGAAYIFDAAMGTLSQTLVNPTPDASDYFGYSVAISGNTVVVGTPYDDTGATTTGAAYSFDAATGELLSTLANPSPAVGDSFGSTVAISGNIVVVGALLDDTGATNAGTVYIFEPFAGSLLKTLVNPTPNAEDYFGHCVAVSSGHAVIGAPREDGSTSDRGAVYIFDAYRPAANCTWDGGSTVDNLWTTKANWVGDAVPLPGDNLMFPAGAAQKNNVNDYPAETTFGSVTIWSSGYCFINGVKSTANVVLQPAAQLEVNKIVTGTLTIGAGAKVTITPISDDVASMNASQKITSKPLATGAISPVVEEASTQAVAANTLEQVTAVNSIPIASPSILPTSTPILPASTPILIASAPILIASAPILAACRRVDQVSGPRPADHSSTPLFFPQIFSAKSAVGAGPLSRGLTSAKIDMREGAASRGQSSLNLSPASGEDQAGYTLAKIDTGEGSLYRGQSSLNLSPTSGEDRQVYFAALQTNGFTRSVKSTIGEKADAEVDLEIARHARAGNYARKIEKAIDSILEDDGQWSVVGSTG
jgi:hypothetical protein